MASGQLDSLPLKIAKLGLLGDDIRVHLFLISNCNSPPPTPSPLTWRISCLSLSSRSVCWGKLLFSGPIFASFLSAFSALLPVFRLRFLSSASASSLSRMRLSDERSAA